MNSRHISRESDQDILHIWLFTHAAYNRRLLCLTCLHMLEIHSVVWASGDTWVGGYRLHRKDDYFCIDINTTCICTQCQPKSGS